MTKEKKPTRAPFLSYTGAVGALIKLWNLLICDIVLVLHYQSLNMQDTLLKVTQCCACISI